MNEENTSSTTPDSTSDSSILLDSEGLYNSGSDGAVEYSVVLNEDQYNEISTLQSFASVCLGLELGLMIGLLFFMGLKK